MSNSLVIKNLSIALEAISRVGGSWSQIELFDGIVKLLKAEIKLAEEENTKPITAQTPPTTDPNNDEIPF